jgi:hypothetical protein
MPRAIKNIQSRDTGNIGHMPRAIKNIQSRDTGNIGHMTQNTEKQKNTTMKSKTTKNTNPTTTKY